jgi:hypothetical protein
MYLVKYGTECLHDVRTDNCQLLSLTLDGESNACDHCEFEIATNHPMYDKLKERDLSSPVCVYDGEEMIFSGFIYEIGEEFNRTKTIKCKGELAYLGDTVVRPYSTLKGEYGEIVPNYLSGYFEWLIDQHNLQVDVSKQFVVGYNEGSMLYSGLVYKSSVEYPTTSTEIKEQILDSFGGYLRIRRENGIRYIDLLSEYTDVNEQLIDFGVNILDYAKTDDSLDVYTAIVPLGANMSETDYYYSDGYFLTKDKTPSSIKTYYSQSTYERCSDIETFESGVKYFELLTRDTYTRTADTTPSTFKTYYTKGSMSEQSKLLYFTYGIEYYEKNGDSYYRTPDLTPNYRKSYYTQSWSSNTGVAEWEANTVYYELSSYQWYSETKDSKPIYGKTYYTMAVYSTSKTEEEGLTAFANDKTYYEFDESLNQSDKPLTLSMIADWKVTDDLYHTGDYIFSKENVAAHGLRVFSSKNTDIITVGDLLMWGTKELNSVLSPITTIEIKAIDLSLVDKNYKGIRVGQYVRVRSKPHGFDSYMLCDSIDLDLVNPENTTYTFGMSYDTFTGQQSKKISALNSTINKEYQNAATISQEAKKTAQDALNISKDANNNASSAKDTASSAVVSVTEQYAVSASRTEVPTEGWSTETPSDTDKYVWHRIVTTYGDGSTVVGEPALLTGPNGENAVLLRIDSSRGTVFKNDSISTVLSAVIYNGSNRITGIDDLHSIFGSGAYLQWYWQKVDDETFGVISSGDSMISNNGFTLTIAANQVDTKVTFMCELIT